METKIEKKDSHTIIHVSGRLDTVSAGDFEKSISTILEEMTDTEIDCSELDYISSSGLRLFMLLHKAALIGSKNITIKDMKPDIKSVFDMTGFTKLFLFT